MKWFYTVKTETENFFEAEPSISYNEYGPFDSEEEARMDCDHRLFIADNESIGGHSINYVASDPVSRPV